MNERKTVLKFRIAISLCFAMAATAAAQSVIPRAANGKPDFSGRWEGPFIQDMSKDLRNQKGAGEIPLTDWGKEKMATQIDVSVHCLPTGYVRTTNAPFPLEIVQRPGRIIFLYEINNNFHIVFTDGREHPKDWEPTWAGHSVGKWDGDTLVVDTVGLTDKSWLDRAGHPHSDALHIVERIRRVDKETLEIDLTFDDVKAYTKPWKGRKLYTHRPGWEITEYVCADIFKKPAAAGAK